MYRIEQADCFEWLRQCPDHSLHAVCTDPPYGILEFTEKELAKLFRKPIDTNTVAENLRRWKTGALRRLSTEKPLPDAIPSGRTPKCEEAIFAASLPQA